MRQDGHRGETDIGRFEKIFAGANYLFSFYAEHKYSNLPGRLIIVIFSI